MHRIKLGQALRSALHRTLPSGWLYLPDVVRFTAETPCVLVEHLEMERDVREALRGEFPNEGLSTDLMEDTGEAARLFVDPPSDELLVESFNYYRRFDAYLPKPGAPEPPPWKETQTRIDREFIALLGLERSDQPCRREQCDRGAISHSVLCKRHHFESIRGRPYPFDD
jgi:hypothetical protein